MKKLAFLFVLLLGFAFAQEFGSGAVTRSYFDESFGDKLTLTCFDPLYSYGDIPEEVLELSRESPVLIYCQAASQGGRHRIAKHEFSYVGPDGSEDVRASNVTEISGNMSGVSPSSPATFVVAFPGVSRPAIIDIIWHEQVNEFVFLD